MKKISGMVLKDVVEQLDGIKNSIHVLRTVESSDEHCEVEKEAAYLAKVFPVVQTISVHELQSADAPLADQLCSFSNAAAEIAVLAKAIATDDAEQSKLVKECLSWKLQHADKFKEGMENARTAISERMSNMDSKLIDWPTLFKKENYEDITKFEGKAVLIDGVKWVNGEHGTKILDSYISGLSGNETGQEMKDAVVRAKATKKSAQATRDKSRLQVAVRLACTLIRDSNKLGVAEFYTDAKASGIAVPKAVKAKLDLL